VSNKTAVSDPDALVPDPVVCREFGITSMSKDRWDKDPRMHELGWPAKIVIRKHNFRSRKQLEAFKRNMIQRAIKERAAAK
jgi:hypothetical protein